MKGEYHVLDVDCGVASFSAYLLPLDLQAMSFAQKDGHENKIQFALKPGIGAMIFAFTTKQLPYLATSFEMVHCSRFHVPLIGRTMVSPKMSLLRTLSFGKIKFAITGS